MEEVAIKTHLICTDVHEEYNMKWCGRILDTNPKIENGKPIFIVIGSKGRMEYNTVDMKLLERAAKSVTDPHGRSAINTDQSRIYIQEVDGKETLLGIMTHNHVKTYAPMYDKVGFY